MLKVGHIERRKWRGIKAAIPDVAHNAHDLHPRIFPILPQSPSDRIFIWEEPPREGLVDNDHQWSPLAVGVRERPALKNRRAEGAEIISADKEKISQRVGLARWSGAAFDGEGILKLH